MKKNNLCEKCLKYDKMMSWRGHRLAWCHGCVSQWDRENK